MDILQLVLKPSRHSRSRCCSLARQVLCGGPCLPLPGPGACVSVVCVLLFKFVSFSWRMIAFQCPAGFCPSSAWISHRPSWRSSRPPRSGPSPRPGRAPRLMRRTPSRAVSPRRRTCLCCSPHASRLLPSVHRSALCASTAAPQTGSSHVVGVCACMMCVVCV